MAYQPTPDYHGPDTFTYTVTDAGGASSTGTVHLTLAPVDDKPEAVDDTATINVGNTVDYNQVLNTGYATVEYLDVPSISKENLRDPGYLASLRADTPETRYISYND